MTKVTDGEAAVYEVPGSHDRFWLDKGKILSWRLTNGGYALKIRTSRPTKLYFSEIYHGGWRVKISGEKIAAQKSSTGLNYFEIPAGDYEAGVYFAPQSYMDWGIMVSLATLSIMMAFMIKFGR